VRWRCTGNSAPWSRWRLTGARHSAQYGAPSSAWFGPTVLRECGDAITLTMRKLQSAWMACDGGFYGATLADVEGPLPVNLRLQELDEKLSVLTSCS
jgi:hypothetical protein